MKKLNKDQRERLAEMLRYYRDEADMAQVEVAKQAGMSPEYYSQLERGKLSGSIGTLKRIATAFDVALYKIIRDAAL